MDDTTPEDLVTRLRKAKSDDTDLVYRCRGAAERIEQLKRSLRKWKFDAVRLRMTLEKAVRLYETNHLLAQSSDYDEWIKEVKNVLG